MGDSTLTAESSIPGQPSGLRDLLKLNTKIIAGEWYQVLYALQADSVWLRLNDASGNLVEQKALGITGPADQLDGRFRIGLLYNHTSYYGGYVDNVRVWNYSKITGIEPINEPGLPAKVELFQNYPNPFNPSTEIKFHISKSQKVTLAVYDLLGRKVKTLVDENVTAGKYKVDWNGTNEYGQKVASGIYFYRLQTEGFNQTRKMLLMK
jgi:flagellar hook assembly protein FlgD